MAESIYRDAPTMKAALNSQEQLLNRASAWQFIRSRLNGKFDRMSLSGGCTQIRLSERRKETKLAQVWQKIVFTGKCRERLNGGGVTILLTRGLKS